MNELGKCAARLDILYMVQICQSDMIMVFFFSLTNFTHFGSFEGTGRALSLIVWLVMMPDHPPNFAVWRSSPSSLIIVLVVLARIV